MAKMLFVLDPESQWQRWLRRAIVVGVLTAVAMLLKTLSTDVGVIPPAYFVPLITALLAMIEKAIRDLTAPPQPQ